MDRKNRMPKKLSIGDSHFMLSYYHSQCKRYNAQVIKMIAYKKVPFKLSVVSIELQVLRLHRLLVLSFTKDRELT